MGYKEKTKIVDKEGLTRIITRLTHQILEAIPNIEDCVFIGIQRRGVFLSQRIKQKIFQLEKKEIPLAYIDITLYRDDLTVIGAQPFLRETKIDFDINNKAVVLIDDVLFTGRTVRCALDEIMDFGRPNKIKLVVLVDRGHRELPIRADLVGRNIPTSSLQVVEVRMKEIDSKDEVVLLEKDNNE